MFARLLRYEGYEVDELVDATRIIEHVRETPPDLILLDVMLPGPSGLEACGELRMMPEMRLTPIILVSAAYMDEQSVVGGLLCGADDYIVTPGRLTELRARIRVQLRNLRDRELLHWAREQRSTFKRAALNDALTGIPNRRSADEAIAEAARGDGPMAVMLVDVDHFKKVNDSFGHGVGDEVLKRVAAALAQQTRRDDMVARFGGEEFVVLLRGAQADMTVAIGERFRKAIQALVFSAELGIERVTASFGVAASASGPVEPAAILEVADQALYAAKEGGRNRVVGLTYPTKVDPS